jgi:hypothetical protein
MQNYSLKRKTVVQKISASGALGCQLLKIIKRDVKNKVMQHLRNCKRQKKDEHLSKENVIELVILEQKQKRGGKIVK